MNGQPTTPVAGRRVLVTGASSGIGRAIAVAMARSGASVLATARRDDLLGRLRDEAGAGAIDTMTGDLTDQAFRRQLVADGPIDILVNNAGICQHGPIGEVDPDFWHTLFETNVIAMMALSQLVARDMAGRGAGQIVIVTSVLARQVYPMTVSYAATKHASSAFAQGLRLELKDSGVRVMEFAPGFTGGTEFLRNTVDEAVLKSAFTRPYAPKTPENCAQALMGALAVGGNAEIDLLQMRALGQT